jgi:hypothetical protein
MAVSSIDIIKISGTRPRITPNALIIPFGSGEPEIATRVELIIVSIVGSKTI